MVSAVMARSRASNRTQPTPEQPERSTTRTPNIAATEAARIGASVRRVGGTSGRTSARRDGGLHQRGRTQRARVMALLARCPCGPPWWLASSVAGTPIGPRCSNRRPDRRTHSVAVIVTRIASGVRPSSTAEPDGHGA
jgi:hypothetical protein